jgi:hypothetical protein
MWRVVAVLAALAAVASSDERPGLRALFEPRLLGAGLRQVRLERQIADVHKKLEEAKKVDPEAFFNDINDRIDHVEASNCENKQHDIRCGGHSLECVSTLLLCDGVKDCHNGWDESAKTCSPGPAVSGNEFVGTAHWVSCDTHDDHPVKIIITGTYVPKFFGARIGVRATLIADFTDPDDHSHKEIHFRGMYTLGKKRLILVPQDTQAAKEHLGIICDFVHGNDETAECVFKDEASPLTCATIHVNLQH